MPPWLVCGRALMGLVDAQRLGELVFQDDDAAGGFHRGALVDEFPGARGQAQLVAGVAAMAAAGAQRARSIWQRPAPAGMSG